jgi:hypothetical protein
MLLATWLATQPLNIFFDVVNVAKTHLNVANIFLDVVKRPMATFPPGASTPDSSNIIIYRNGGSLFFPPENGCDFCY